jgi:hypothetical protein
LPVFKPTSSPSFGFSSRCLLNFELFEFDLEWIAGLVDLGPFLCVCGALLGAFEFMCGFMLFARLGLFALVLGQNDWILNLNLLL